MQPSIKKLGEILYAPCQYVIPVFQRNYRWDQQQWGKLWESLEEIQQPNKTGNHFMGFLVFVPGLPQPGQNTHFHLIDGQQRLTTLSLLLVAIRNVARTNEQQDLANKIHQYYLIHPTEKGEEHYRLLPKERDQTSYTSAVNGGEEKADGRIIEAIAFFENRCESLAKDDPEALRRIFNIICQRLEFMCATLEAENAYNIFKSLNSTGVKLGPSDLIRNFVFMHVLPDDQDEFDQKYWAPIEGSYSHANGTLDDVLFSKFFRDFLMTSGRYVSPNVTFETFEQRYEATKFIPVELALSLKKYSHYYDIVRGIKNDIDKEVTQALEKLNALESSTTYPLLLALFEQRSGNQITSDDLTTTIEALQSFILRRFICGESSRGYGQIFVRACALVNSEGIKGLLPYLVERGWPNDLKFKEAFIRFPLYERDYKKYILTRLEQQQGHKEPVILDDAEIEHIMPQTLNEAWRSDLGAEHERIYDQWLNCPGNLTLSGYNQELWNHPFERKRNRYKDSNIVITRRLEQDSVWTEHEMQKRGMWLADLATEIWVAPVELEPAAAPVTNETEPLDRYTVRQAFWDSLVDYIKAEAVELPLFESRQSNWIRLDSGLRHIGFELKFALRENTFRIEVWFWRESSMPVWRELRDDPTIANFLIGQEWQFDQQNTTDRARMFIEHRVSNIRSQSEWPNIHAWCTGKLQILYNKIRPALETSLSQTTKAA